MADKYYRLVCFVVDICADVLRKYFVKLAKTDSVYYFTTVEGYLLQRKSEINQLLTKKKIRKDQFDLLYPGHGTADENQWDVSILVTLITELFTSRLQPLEIFALKTEIRDIRNDLQHNPNTGNISDDDFNSHWSRLDSAIMLLAKDALDPKENASLPGKINQVKCNHLPNLSDFLRIWHEETTKELLNKVTELEANTKETTSILRQVTVQKPGPSGDKNKRFKVVDNILARLQAGFEATMKDFPDDFKPPKEVTDIRTKLRDYHHVVVAGYNNSRYLETALAAVKGMNYNLKRSVEMNLSSDWRHIDPEDVDFVLCRDPFGSFSYDESKARAMGDIFQNMMHSTKAQKCEKYLNIVIVTDFKILEECKMHHDHEILEEVVTVFTETSSTKPADLTNDCTNQSQFAQLSSLPISRNLGVMTRNFLKEYQIFSQQVDASVLKRAKEKFKTRKAIVLTGHKKCGKSSIAVALSSAYDPSQCLLLMKPNDVYKIDFGNVCLVIIDEFAGKYRYEENHVFKWYNMFEHLYRSVTAGQLNVIITCEKSKLDKCMKEIGRHALLDHVIDVPLQTNVIKSEDTEKTETQLLYNRSIPGVERAQRSRTPSSVIVREQFNVNIKTSFDNMKCNISSSCFLPSGEILLADYYNKNLKKLDNVYKVNSVCDLPILPRDVCYVGDNVAVVSMISSLQFVNTRQMSLMGSVGIDHGCIGLACHGSQMYVRDLLDSVYSYSKDGIKQKLLFSCKYNISYMMNRIAVCDDGSKLYIPYENKLVTIDNNGNHLFTLNYDDINYFSGICVDDHGYIYISSIYKKIMQISADGTTILREIAEKRITSFFQILTFDRINEAIIAGGVDNEILILRLR